MLRKLVFCRYQRYEQVSENYFPNFVQSYAFFHHCARNRLNNECEKID